MNKDQPIIRIQNLKKSYDGENYVLCGIDVDIFPGQIIGYIGLITFLFPAALGGIHYGLTLLPYAIPIAIVLALGIAYLGMKLYGQTTWKMIS